MPNPPATGSNLILWITGPALLVIGLAGMAVYLRRRRLSNEKAAVPLSDDERARLAELLKE